MAKATGEPLKPGEVSFNRHRSYSWPSPICRTTLHGDGSHLPPLSSGTKSLLVAWSSHSNSWFDVGYHRPAYGLPRRWRLQQFRKHFKRKPKINKTTPPTPQPKPANNINSRPAFKKYIISQAPKST